MSNWSEEIEEICDKLRVNCVNLSEYHRKRYYHFKSYGKWFRLPLIILASVNSTASVGLQPVLDQTIISGITCLIGMIMGIIGSLELYLGIQTSMETELKHSKDYYTLGIHIFKTLSLNRVNRLEDGKEYLNEKYSLYIKLCESSNLLEKRMKNDLLATVPQTSAFESGKNSMEMPDLHDLDSHQPINHDNIQKMKVLENTNIINKENQKHFNSETIPLVNEVKKSVEKVENIENELIIDISNNVNV